MLTRCSRSFAAALLILSTVARHGHATPARHCAGDCDGDGFVTVDEIVRLVGAALAGGTGDCAAGDLDENGGISVDEIVSAVSAALLGCDAPVFGPDLTTRFPRPKLPVGEMPAALAATDVDGDERADIASLGAAGGSLSVLFQKQGGGFQPRHEVPAGAGANSLRAAPLRPGQPSALLVTDSAADALAVTSFEDGAFATATFPAGDAPTALAAADLDRDSFTDVVVANADTGLVHVLLGAEDGFETAMPFEAGGRPGWLAIGDLDDDDVADVVASLGTTQLAYLRGAGGGALASPAAIDVGLAANAVEIGDLNGDGRNDLVVRAASVDSPGIVAAALLNDGAGGFDRSHEFQGEAAATAMALDDADGDGVLDVVIGWEDAVAVFFGRGDGTFLDRLRLRTDAAVSAVAVADVDTDGIRDVVYAAVADDEVSIFWGRGNRELAVERTFPTGGALSERLLAPDVDADGLADLATLNPGSDDVSILRNLGGGVFAEPVIVDVESQLLAMAFGHFDHDHFADLVAGYGNATCEDCIAAFRGLGDGGFDAPMTFGVMPRIRALGAGRIDGDMIDDLVSLSAGGVSVLQGLGGLLFAPAETYATGADPRAMVVIDLNDDGFADVATANAASVSVLLADAAGGLAPAVSLATAIAPVHIDAADLDGDGTVDLAVGGVARFAVFYGTGGGAFASALEIPSIHTGARFDIADVNDDARADLVSISNGLIIHAGAAGALFSAPQEFGIDALAAEALAGDWNADGAADIATPNAGADGSVSVVFGAPP